MMHDVSLDYCNSSRLYEKNKQKQKKRRSELKQTPIVRIGLPVPARGPRATEPGRRPALARDRRLCGINFDAYSDGTYTIHNHVECRSGVLPLKWMNSIRDFPWINFNSVSLLIVTTKTRAVISLSIPLVSASCSINYCEDSLIFKLKVSVNLNLDSSMSKLKISVVVSHVLARW